LEYGLLGVRTPNSFIFDPILTTYLKDPPQKDIPYNFAVPNFALKSLLQKLDKHFGLRDLKLGVVGVVTIVGVVGVVGVVHLLQNRLHFWKADIHTYSMDFEF